MHHSEHSTKQAIKYICIKYTVTGQSKQTRKHSENSNPAEDFHVLFLAVYRNHNSKQRMFLKNSRIAIVMQIQIPDRHPDHHQNLIDCSLGHASLRQKIIKIRS